VLALASLHLALGTRLLESWRRTDRADAPFGLVNVVAGLVYAVAMPFVGIATTYVYYDTLVRERLDETAPTAAELPAEI